MPRLPQLAFAALTIATALAAAPDPQRRPAPKHAAPHKPTKPASSPQPAPPDASLIRALRENAIGLALMDRRDYISALGHFQSACVLNPASDTGCLNMGIALLNLRHYDDAQRILSKSVEQDPQNARAWFNLALLARAAGDTANAHADFQKVAAIDPDDSGTHYFLGYLASQDEKYRDAAKEFARALELDPLNVSAEFGLAQAQVHLDDRADAAIHFTHSQAISARKLGAPMRFLYGEQGRYSLAQEMVAPPVPVTPATLVRFLDVTAISGLPQARPSAPVPGRAKSLVDSVEVAAPSLAAFLGSGACVFDFDGDGRPDIFLADADGKGAAALYRNTGKGSFVNATKSAKLDLPGSVMACAVGDYDNDGHPDLAVTSADGVLLFHNEGNGTFKDVTQSASLKPGPPAADDAAALIDPYAASQPADPRSTDAEPSGPTAFATGVTFIDYDQDGDLDIYITRFTDFPIDSPAQPFTFPSGVPAPGNLLWRNQGDGTFVDRTTDLALAGAAPSMGALATGLRNNRSIDLVVTGWQNAPSVFLNPREGPFRPANPWAAAMPGPAAGVVAADFDHDGWMDLAFTHWASPAVTVWRNVKGKSFERVPLADPGWMRAWGIAALDYDNDGWVDLVAVGETFSSEGRIALWRNEGPAGFRDVTRETGLDKIVLRNPRAVIPFDFAGDGSPALLITRNHQPPLLLKNVGGNKNAWIKLALAGDPDNKLGIGARFDIFSGAARQTWDLPGASGYLSQGPPEILTGLGSEDAADVVRIFWPTGRLQNELRLESGASKPIPESEPAEPPAPAARQKGEK